MVYFPVLIPTLNRADHLKRCVESLARNTGAENTELYISVDFPPHEKYYDGYHQVKQLLSVIDLSAFKKAHIFFQETNLGPSGNSEFLKLQVEERYDAYIFSEDDNEFAPNFLEYMNKGLNVFRDDPKVLSVCAAKDTEWKTNGKNILFTKLFAAYGVGIWFHKREQEVSLGTGIILPDKPYSLRKMYKLYKQNSCLFCIYILAVLSTDTGLFWKNSETLNWCDSLHSLYMHFTDSVCIAPAIAKARTWGNDGSGVNMPKTDSVTADQTPLDKALNFEFDNIDDLEFIEDNYKLGNAYLPHSKSGVLKAFICYFILLIFGKNRKGAVKFLTLPRKMWNKIKSKSV